MSVRTLVNGGEVTRQSETQRYPISGGREKIDSFSYTRLSHLEHLANPLVFLPQDQNGVLSAGLPFLEKCRTVQNLMSRQVRNRYQVIFD